MEGGGSGSGINVSQALFMQVVCKHVLQHFESWIFCPPSINFCHSNSMLSNIGRSPKHKPSSDLMCGFFR